MWLVVCRGGVAVNRSDHTTSDIIAELLCCARCCATVAVQPAADAWCLTCGQRMRQIRPKGTP